MPTDEEKTWAMLAHLAGIAGYLGGVLQYIAPLVIFFVYKEKSKFVAFHALQSLFFQLALLVLVAGLNAVGFLACGVGLFVTVPLSIALAVGGLVYCIVAAIKAHGGEMFQYWLVGGWARQAVGL